MIEEIIFGEVVIVFREKKNVFGKKIIMYGKEGIVFRKYGFFFGENRMNIRLGVWLESYNGDVFHHNRHNRTQ